VLPVSQLYSCATDGNLDLLPLQILDGDQYRLQQSADAAPRIPHDFLRLVCGPDCFLGPPIWLEGSGLHEAHRGAALHGVAGCGLSGERY